MAHGVPQVETASCLKKRPTPVSNGQLEAVWLRERLHKLDFSAEFDARLRLVSFSIAGTELNSLVQHWTAHFAISRRARSNTTIQNWKVVPTHVTHHSHYLDRPQRRSTTSAPVPAPACPAS